MIRKVLGFVVLMLAAAGIVYLVNPNFPVGVFSTPESEESHVEPQVIEAEISHAALGEKYFSQEELDQWGLEMDLTEVAYRADLDLEDLYKGCRSVDCIPSIDTPRFEPADVIWMYDGYLVIGIEYNGIAKAYPISILDRHEIVNDTFANTKVVVSYCPLCNSAVAFVAPIINGRAAEFGVSGRLYKSDLVMYDRVTYSFWSQIEGQVIVGPLAGASPVIERIPVDIATWEGWTNRHPDTVVLSRPTNADAVGGQPPTRAEGEREKRQFDYSEDPYRWYRGNESDTNGLEVNDKRLPNKATVIGIETDQGSKAYERDVVAVEKIINDTIQGQSIVVVYDEAADQIRAFQRPTTSEMILSDGLLKDGNAQWTLMGQPQTGTDTPLEMLQTMPVYWFAWASFHPETELYQN